MLTVLSPAKRLDWSPTDVAPTEPEFIREAGILAGHARQLSLAALKRLMDLSDDLARLNRDRFRDFAAEPSADLTKPAVLAFAGDTYQGLDAGSLDAETLDYAQRHLRILSGLYGVLRPLDAIQPYRLEMGSRLRTRRGQTLYAFWRDLPAKALNAAAEEVGSAYLINCASPEYFGAVDLTSLRPSVITPQFFERKGEERRMVSFYAKQARGSMARFVLERRIDRPEGIIDFDFGGYRHDPATSTPERPVFVRDQVQALRAAS